MGDLSAHFCRSEFACRCGCSAADINLLLIERLEAVRAAYAHPIAVTSGVRCRKHNLVAGGVEDSAHLYGLAADLALPADMQHSRHLLLLLLSEFERVGISPLGFVHVDVDPSKPAGAWVYKHKTEI